MYIMYISCAFVSAFTPSVVCNLRMLIYYVHCTVRYGWKSVKQFLHNKHCICIFVSMGSVVEPRFYRGRGISASDAVFTIIWRGFSASR